MLAGSAAFVPGSGFAAGPTCTHFHLLPSSIVPVTTRCQREYLAWVSVAWSPSSVVVKLAPRGFDHSELSPVSRRPPRGVVYAGRVRRRLAQFVEIPTANPNLPRHQPQGDPAGLGSPRRLARIMQTLGQQRVVESHKVMVCKELC